MGNRFGYTISGPEPEAIDLPIHLSKSLSMKREPRDGENNLRDLYQHPATLAEYPASFSAVENGTLRPATPILPPTPPNIEDEVDCNADEPTSASEAAKVRSMLVTPVNQISPPTPDNTPPREKLRLRPFLGAQPSMASTRAESFKTAREDFTSDNESASSLATSQPGLNRSSPLLPLVLTNGVYKPSPLASLPITNGDLTSKESSPVMPSSAIKPLVNGVDNTVPDSKSNGYAHIPTLDLEDREAHVSPITPPWNGGAQQDTRHTVRSRKEGPQRGRSLRERLEDSRVIQHSPSVDKFANIIGWSSSVQNFTEEQKRWSGVSNTSTVEAFLVEKPRMQKKPNTLRHVSKNDSLRSVSSPLPNSNRTSMQSSSDSPHRLIHKKAKLSNHNRLSFGSEMSHSISIGSHVMPKIEIIKVAVIPERSSSLQRSTNSSSRHSHSTSGAPTAFRIPRTSDSSQRRRTITDTTDRGRDRHYPPQVPPRGSSLSAPTSRNTSRANSITSDHVFVERKRAEKDLRLTLDRMESEMLASSLKSTSVDDVPITTTINGHRPDVDGHKYGTGDDAYSGTTPGSTEWAELRPTSTLHTPFSQPSFMSASPEISEAKMISLHPHNNHSVQLIEPFSLHESRAVEEARKMNYGHYPGSENIDSPLRNPRRPPSPPQFYVIPATPQDEIPVQLEPDTLPKARPTTPRRPVVRTRTDSFGKTLLRSISLKNARNKKADQDLDSTLHPFWRPRPFWDGIEGASPEKKRATEFKDRGLVNNSLGLPQHSVVIAGPLGLVRKLSERRRNRKVIAKQSSYHSLQRLRGGRKLHRLPGLGVHLPLMSVKDIQDKVVAARQKKEDVKREKRREALRKSIGPNVVATGDSRFPAIMTGDDGQDYEGR